MVKFPLLITLMMTVTVHCYGSWPWQRKGQSLNVCYVKIIFLTHQCELSTGKTNQNNFIYK